MNKGKNKLSKDSRIDVRLQALVEPDWDSQSAMERQTKAADLLGHWIEREPEEAWPHIVNAIRHAPNDIIRGSYAVAFIESLLLLHGKRFIDRIEQEAQRDLRFKNSLKSIAQKVGGKRMSVQLFNRILKITGSQPHDLQKELTQRQIRRLRKQL